MKIKSVKKNNQHILPSIHVSAYMHTVCHFYIAHQIGILYQYPFKTSPFKHTFPTETHSENTELGKPSAQKLENVKITLAINPYIGSHFM